MPRILIADADPSSREQLQHLLEPFGFQLDAADTLPQAMAQVEAEEHPFDLILADLSLPEGGGMELLQRARRRDDSLEVILLAAFGGVDDAKEALRLGASDYLEKPLANHEVQVAVERALEKHYLVRENRDLREALDDRFRLQNMVASSPAMAGVIKTAKVVAKARTTVLITGESGTGKTVLARSIHSLSPRAAGPFIEVNCGALPENLLESELFGHAKGAFTGAVKDRPGKFEAADGGTIFLDEIGTSSPAFQIKLLRVLQDRAFERVGDSTTRTTDVRVILATNADLAQAVQDGDFREDLYYRIHVVTIDMPPLRDRPEDVADLAQHFLTRFAGQQGKALKGYAPAALRVMQRSPWPGNVRQLENAVERAVVMCEGDRITPDDLPPDLLADMNPNDTNAVLEPMDHLLPYREAMAQFERNLLQRALAHHDGNRSATARSLGITRSTLFDKMRKHDLQ